MCLTKRKRFLSSYKTFNICLCITSFKIPSKKESLKIFETIKIIIFVSSLVKFWHFLSILPPKTTLAKNHILWLLLYRIHNRFDEVFLNLSNIFFLWKKKLTTMVWQPYKKQQMEAHGS